MNEDYVSFEQAKTLKELGFDWECFSCYIKVYKGDDGWRLRIYDRYQSYNDERDERCISAPTLAQAQKWLREVKGKIIIPYVMHIENIMKYDFYIADEPIDPFDYSDGFDTYELALSAGIDKALELVKE